ncbi:MAG: hypothetical protein HY666_04295 [Chloroflexi bacterium]|nr:hypothetical protein [Chloroflexota bacterium]
MNIALPLLSSIISLFFALALLDQYLNKRRPYELMWAIGLALYSLGTGAEFVAGVFGVSLGAFKVWYLAGAILVPPYLAMGTVYLLLHRRVAHIVLALVVLVTVFSAVRVSASGVNFDVGIIEEAGVLTIRQSVAQGEPMSGRAWIDSSVRDLSQIAIVGAFVVIAGAIYSAVLFGIRGTHPYRVVSNLLIAVGLLIPAIGGGLARRADLHTYLYISEFVGIIIIYVGFLRSREVFEVFQIPFIRRAREP